VKAAIECHPAMLHQNHTSGCFRSQNCAATNLQTRWGCKGTGAPQPAIHRPTTPLPGKPSAAPGNNLGAQLSQIVNLPARYAYSHTTLLCAELFNLDSSAQDSQHDADFDPDC